MKYIIACKHLVGPIFLLILSLLPCTYVCSQDYVVTKLKLFPDRDEVLIKDLAIDSKGFIWFLTNGEIYRFDGYRSLDILKTITTHVPTADMPQRILIDNQDRMWMASNANLSYLDLKTWQVHDIADHLLPSVNNRSIFSLTELPDSTMVIAYENGHLLLAKNDQFKRIDKLYEHGRLSNNKLSPRSITAWKNKIWVGTTGGYLFSVDPGKGYQTQIIKLKGEEDNVRSLISHGDTLLVDVPNPFQLTLSEGCVKKMQPPNFDLSMEKSVLIKEGDHMHLYAEDATLKLLSKDLRLLQQLKVPTKHKFRIVATSLAKEEIIAGTEDGIFVAYPKTKGLSELRLPDGGPNSSTRGIYVYPDGAIFYGTYSGAGYVNPEGQTMVFSGLKYAYTIVPMNDNELLIGTEGGFLKVFNRKKLQIESLSYSLSSNVRNKYANNLPVYVMSLEETATDFLIGASNGLWMLNKSNRQLDRYELTDGSSHALDLQIRHIQQVAKDRLLLSTHIGLFELHDGKLRKRYPTSGNMGVYKVILDGETIWVATQGAGLIAIDHEGQSLHHLTTTNGLSNNLIYSLEKFNEWLVIGTANGLNIVDVNHQVRRLGMTEGINQSEFNSSASYADTLRKRIYMGGLTGYTILDMQQEWFGTHNPLKSYVTEMHISDRKLGVKISDYTWPYSGITTLPLNPNQSLTALYVGTPSNYRASNELYYAINKGNFETLALGQFISLIEASPGRYSIDLQTITHGLQANLNSITVVKDPHFYETWWFNLLIGTVAIGLVGWWYRSRLSKLRREHTIRNQIAADLHDEVGSALTRIFFQANSLTDHLADPQLPRQLSVIATTSQQALLIMSDMVWSIDSRFDTTKDLVIRMKDYVYKLRQELDFRYRFEENGESDAGKMSQAVRQNVFLIFKEALTNAIKYSDGSEILISMAVDPFVLLSVTNRYTNKTNTFSHRQGGHGLENMEQRAGKAGGKLSVRDNGQVFSIILEIPPKRGILNNGFTD